MFLAKQKANRDADTHYTQPTHNATMVCHNGTLPSFPFLFPLHTPRPNGLQTSNFHPTLATLQSEITLPLPPQSAIGTMQQLDPPCQTSENAITPLLGAALGPSQENNQKSTHPSRERKEYNFQFFFSSGTVTSQFERTEKVRQKYRHKGMRRGKEEVSI